MAEQKKTNKPAPEQNPNLEAEDSPASGQPSSSHDEAGHPIKPYGVKIGESRDNLRRREEWFQRRSGKGK